MQNLKGNRTSCIHPNSVFGNPLFHIATTVVKIFPKHILDSLREPDDLRRVLRLLNEPNLTRPMAAANSGWSSADLRPLWNWSGRWRRAFAGPARRA